MKTIRQILDNPKYSVVASALYIVVTTGVMRVLPQSMFAFLFLLASLLVLWQANMDNRVKTALGAVVLFGVLPLVAGGGSIYYLDILTQMGIYTALALGLNIQVGFAGLFVLGYIAFYAVGAYLYAILGSPQAANFISFVSFPLPGYWFWLLIPAGIAAAALAGVVIGLPVFRLRGDYLAIVTLGFGEIVRILANNLDKPINITNGPKGITPIMPPSLFGFEFNTPTHLYFISVIVTLVVIVLSRRLEVSRVGRALVAIREDEVAAKAMGVNLVRYKLVAFATGASFAGVMGMLFAVKQTFINPQSFTFMDSIIVLAMVILGGVGSIPGVIIGATSVTLLKLLVLKELSFALQPLGLPNSLDPVKYQPIVFGLILIIMMIKRPEGLVPSVRPRIDLTDVGDSPRTGAGVAGTAAGGTSGAEG